MALQGEKQANDGQEAQTEGGERVLGHARYETTLPEDPVTVDFYGVHGTPICSLANEERSDDYTVQRDVMFAWHCYRQADRSWAQAWLLAPRLACLGAICANDWLSDMVDDEIGDFSWMLPADTVRDNVALYDGQAAVSPFYARYAAERGEDLAKLIDDYPNNGAAWALGCVYDDVRKSFALCRVAGRQALRSIDDDLETAEENGAIPTGTTTRGIAEANEQWFPVSMIGERWEGADGDDAGNGGDDVIEEIGMDDVEGCAEEREWEDGILSLIWLQAYIEAGRSWVKAEPIVEQIVGSVIGFAAVALSPAPNLGETGQDQDARAAKLEELAEELSDGRGGVELRVDPAKPPIEGAGEIRYQLDDESAEFLRLLDEQRRFIELDRADQTALLYARLLPGARSNVYGMLADVMASRLADAGAATGHGYAQAFDRLSKELTKRAKAMGPAAKSRWKKVLKGDPDLARMAKEGATIAGYGEDGFPRLVSLAVCGDEKKGEE